MTSRAFSFPCLPHHCHRSSLVSSPHERSSLLHVFSLPFTASGSRIYIRSRSSSRLPFRLIRIVNNKQAPSSPYDIRICLTYRKMLPECYTILPTVLAFLQKRMPLSSSPSCATVRARAATLLERIPPNSSPSPSKDPVLQVRWPSFPRATVRVARAWPLQYPQPRADMLVIISSFLEQIQQLIEAVGKTAWKIIGTILGVVIVLSFVLATLEMVWVSVTGQKKKTERQICDRCGREMALDGCYWRYGLPDDAPLRECKKVCWWCSRVLRNEGHFLTDVGRVGR